MANSTIARMEETRWSIWLDEGIFSGYGFEAYIQREDYKKCIDGGRIRYLRVWRGNDTPENVIACHDEGWVMQPVDPEDDEAVGWLIERLKLLQPGK